ncbi:MAG: CinA family protein [Acidimicrobiales bacterium]|nr:MAG: CinA family protein [Acidimicrobiales bacterium]
MYDDINRLATTVVELAKSKGKTIGTAESCTGGWIGQALTTVPGSSSVFMGGLTTYSNEVKINVLGIPTDIINFYGAVSDPTANAMAMQARDLLGVDIAVSVTGIAGPGGGTTEKPVGLVYFGLATGARPNTYVKKFGDIGRENVRVKSVIYALELIRDALTD